VVKAQISRCGMVYTIHLGLGARSVAVCLSCCNNLRCGNALSYGERRSVASDYTLTTK